MTDAEFELELVEALNMLLEDERASVEMEVALASGATEYGEREMLAGMGAEDIRFCVQLREEMEQAGLPVTPQINGVVFEVVGSERYDDRLRAFAHHQRVVADRARELQESNLEGGLREALDGISVSHDLHAEWVERRATDFAATRTLEFGISARARAAAAEEAAAGAEVAELEEPIAPVEPAETVEKFESGAPDASVAAETSSAEEPLAVVEVPVVEPEAAPVEPTAPAPEESAAPPKPRARASTTGARSTSAKGGAKSGATRAKAAPKKPSTTTPKPRARRSAPTPQTPPDEA